MLLSKSKIITESNEQFEVNTNENFKFEQEDQDSTH
jgi:hypothetical protein